MITKDNKIICSVPITGATSKIRVKRRKDNFGEPISVINNNFTESDYVEWQISYFLPIDSIWDSYRKSKSEKDVINFVDKFFVNYKSKEIIGDLKKFLIQNSTKSKKEFKDGVIGFFKDNDETIIVKEQKNGNSYVSYELSDLFKFALENNIISKIEIEKLLKFNDTEKIDIEKQYKIKRIATGSKIIDKFEYFEEKTPLFVNRVSDKTFVEIILQHKQRAVGYQSMVYFCSYANNLSDKKGDSIIGRTAQSKEIIYLPLTKEDLVGVAESFIVASSDHAWDMKKILKDIIK
jgi:hypothetical protein